ncbi:MAG: 2Fe-2S iron-sulfur cluster binding domain-containing protein [Snowella sp.]|nr:2Fe-2S iron-sulfur cluster binding domain-containing protein [Snowella sp.]
MSVNVLFMPDEITTTAEPGDLILEVAERAGVFIPTGCLMGSCHACEVEIEADTPICACISAIPDGVDSVTITLYSDPVW